MQSPCLALLASIFWPHLALVATVAVNPDIGPEFSIKVVFEGDCTNARKAVIQSAANRFAAPGVFLLRCLVKSRVDLREGGPSAMLGDVLSSTTGTYM